ncbi:uncharacterized protein LOC34623890 [Cyclospora cayetanensis]|uniref:Uncharacterized protein LOC34623890 n=1 Tax=Cyclospora cayetanensis TaxID=88456 RepID=A0A6P6RPN3_9EIME|nr:uncharacterized protein LOC34623890 [Cyclospora cayetanensis]
MRVSRHYEAAKAKAVPTRETQRLKSMDQKMDEGSLTEALIRLEKLALACEHLGNVKLAAIESYKRSKAREALARSEVTIYKNYLSDLVKERDHFYDTAIAPQEMVVAKEPTVDKPVRGKRSHLGTPRYPLASAFPRAVEKPLRQAFENLAVGESAAFCSPCSPPFVADLETPHTPCSCPLRPPPLFVIEASPCFFCAAAVFSRRAGNSRNARCHNGCCLEYLCVAVAGSLGISASEEEIAAFYASVNGGDVTLEAFTAFCASAAHPEDVAEELASAFALWDPSSSGYITKQQLRHALTQFGEGLNPQEVNFALEKIAGPGDQVNYLQFCKK